MGDRKFKAELFNLNETPATIRIEDHYRRIGVIPGFRLFRVERVARKLGCTLHELGRMAGMEFGEVDSCVRKGRFPPSPSIQFAVIESFFDMGTKDNPVLPVHLLKEQDDGSPSDFEEVRDDAGTPAEDL